MPGCPSCGRPVALARATCLYCGAPLPEELTRPAEAASADAVVRAELDPRAPAVAASEPRELLVLELVDVTAESLERAAGLSAYDAARLLRRGGPHLWRALATAEAEAAAARLAASGITAYRVPEAEARVRPVRAISGERRASGFALRGEEGVVELADADLLLVVSGEIARAYQATAERRRVDTARPESGWLLHLHRRAEARPIEIDASNFGFGFSVTGSARLELAAWIDALPASVARDDGFRRQPVALSPAEPETRGPLAFTSSLRRRSARPLVGRPGSRAESEPPGVLDNVSQFRFYSGWRAAVERRRSSPPPHTTC